MKNKISKISEDGLRAAGLSNKDMQKENIMKVKNKLDFIPKSKINKLRLTKYGGKL